MTLSFPCKSFRRAQVVLAAGGLALLVGLSGCNRDTRAGRDESQNADPNATHVETVPVERSDLVRKIELPGTVEGYESAELYAKLGGYLESVQVDIGDRVKAGQPLAKLRVPEMHKQLAQRQAEIELARARADQAKAGVRQASAGVEQAEAMLEEAKSELTQQQAQVKYRETEFQRYDDLVRQDAAVPMLRDEAMYQLQAARAALASVQAAIRTAEAALTAAKAGYEKAISDERSAAAEVNVARAAHEYVQARLEYATIRAPFDGVITKRHMHTGAFVQPAEGNSAAKPLFNVARTDKVRVFLDIPMAEVRLLNHEDRAVLDRINVLPGETFEGRVTRFASSLHETSRMMRVEVDLENTDHRLLPGYYGYVTLYLDELPETPTVPSSALMTQGDETFVYVVEAGRVRKQVITTNFQDGTVVGVASGLRGYEQVVKSGGGQLSEGQPVVASAASAQRQ